MPSDTSSISEDQGKSIASQSQVAALSLKSSEGLLLPLARDSIVTQNIESKNTIQDKKQEEEKGTRSQTQQFSPSSSSLSLSSSGSPSLSSSSSSTSSSGSDQEIMQMSFTIGVTEGTPYPCQFCDKAFPRLSYLKRHEQVSRCHCLPHHLHHLSKMIDVRVKGRKRIPGPGKKGEKMVRSERKKRGTN